MSLKERGISAVKWIGLSKGVVFISDFLVSIILARLLSPSEFGLLGMVLVFAGFIAIFQNLGFSQSIIHRQDINDVVVSSVFWFILFVGIIISLIFFISADYIVIFYDEPKLRNVVRVLSITFLLSSIQSLPSALYSKNISFKIPSIIHIVSSTISGSLAILLAYLEYSIWALVSQRVVNSVLSTILIYYYASWRPSFIFSFSEVKKCWNYGKGITFFNIFNYLVRHLDNLLLGKFVGSYDLGIYSRGYNYVTMPLNQISSVVSGVMFPILSKFQDDLHSFKSYYLKSCAYIAILTFPVMGGIFVVSDLFVKLILGPQWIDLIPLIKVFAIVGAIQSVGTTVGWIYLATGKTEMYMKWGIFSSIFTTIAFIIGIQFGSALSMAISYASMNLLVLTIPSFLYPFSIIKLRLGSLVNCLRGVIYSTLSMVIILLILQKILIRLPIPEFIVLLICVVSGIFLYLILTLLLNFSVLDEILKYLFSNIYDKYFKNNKIYNRIKYNTYLHCKV